MKILLSLLILCIVPFKIEPIPFESQCRVSEQCEPLDLIQFKMADQTLYLITDTSNYMRYKNNFDSIIWQTFFDSAPVGHRSLAQQWHLSNKDVYEYTQEIIRFEGDRLHEYTHRIKGDALVYSIIEDVLEDFNQLVGDETITTRELFNKQAEAISNQRINQYRTESLNGTLVYAEAGEVPDELLVMMAQAAFENISGYYEAVFQEALNGALAEEMKEAVLYVELVEEDELNWLTLSEKPQMEDSETVMSAADESAEENSDDWIYVSLILTVLFVLIVWFFGASG